MHAVDYAVQSMVGKPRNSYGGYIQGTLTLVKVQVWLLIWWKLHEVQTGRDINNCYCGMNGQTVTWYDLAQCN